MSLQTEYDVWHQRVFESDPEHEDASSPWYQLVREKIGLVSGLRVLEVACGRDGFVRELASAAARVTECDFSFLALCVARRKIAEASSDSPAALVHGDVQQLPFADDSFDLIASCETIEHVLDVRMAILEMHRVTRPGGKLFRTTPNYANLSGLYELYARARRRKRNDDQPFDRRPCFPQIRNGIRGAGGNFGNRRHRSPIPPPARAVSGAARGGGIQPHRAAPAWPVCAPLFRRGSEEGP
jgi:SAM-dependent methyltransferase